MIFDYSLLKIYWLILHHSSNCRYDDKDSSDKDRTATNTSSTGGIIIVIHHAFHCETSFKAQGFLFMQMEVERILEKSESKRSLNTAKRLWEDIRKNLGLWTISVIMSKCKHISADTHAYICLYDLKISGKSSAQGSLSFVWLHKA